MTIKERIQNVIGDPGKRAPSIGAGFLLSFTLLFFGPSYMYYGNILEIPYYYSDMVWIFVAYSLVAAAVISAILLILKGTSHQRAVALVFALGLLFWIQGHILVWDYGVLDGREIIWNDYLLNGIIDSAVWIAVLGVALFKAPSFYKHIALASVLLLVVQGGGLAAEIYQAPDEPEWKSYAIGYDDETMFEFSKEQNVIILVLDGFQSDVFQEIIEEDKEYREMFDGFTYYRNAVGGYPSTYASVTYILTGEHYDNSIPVQDFIKSAFLNNSIPRTLKENGYRVDLYPHGGSEVYLGDEIVSNTGSLWYQNLSEVERVTDNHKGAMELQRLTLFRYVPHILKSYFHLVPFVELGEGNDVHRDIVFYRSMPSLKAALSEERAFKYYHLYGVHLPYRLNAQLQDEKLPQNRSGCKESSKAALKIAGELIEQLKKHGLYDNSMIFIMGDHGTSWGGIGLNTGSLGKDAFKTSPVNEDTVASGIPLILMKPFNSRGSLSISDAPATLGDIPQTIVTELHLPNKFSGVSLLSLNESDERDRKFFYYTSEAFHQNTEYWRGYLPEMCEYSIKGHSWRLSSWCLTDRIYTPGEGPLHTVDT
ncbi:hypothetical protein MBBA_0129 [Methanoculleus bourgensis]|uniref:sulfatase-like hydrolase/transferase n=1 Tax=Methanoculleus bourgensis TaxID=83986 RepID=UPI0007BCE1A6|nr:hypothetical protein MBBA_0129 [Methanoculleus bourgensis]